MRISYLIIFLGVGIVCLVIGLILGTKIDEETRLESGGLTCKKIKGEFYDK